MIELVVALGLLSVVLLFVFNTFSYQQATYTVVDQVSETHQNSQAIARLIERDARHAGYLVPPGAAACGVDSTSAADILFVSDTDAILPADQLPVEVAGRELAAEVSTSDDPTALGPPAKVLTVDRVVIDDNLDTAALEGASYDTDANGTNDSDFRVGGGAILADLGNPSRGVACGIVTAVDASAPYSVSVNFLTLHDSGGVSSAKQLVLVPAHVYQVVAGSPPRLERDGVLLAKDIEDLQVAWFYDDNTNGDVDASEVRGVPGEDYETDSVVGAELREIRINLVARTRSDDPRNPDNTGIGQARENRDAASVPAEDGKHRRVHTATVLLRNLTI